MPTIADVYRALNALVEEKVVEKYAVCGGTAALFYAETSFTYDIDIFVFLSQSGLIIDLGPIYRWAEPQGFTARDEHLLIHGVPVQVLVANEGLESEAVHSAKIMDYDGVDVPVVAPEYLILMYLKVASPKRRGRAFDLMEIESLDRELLKSLIERYNLGEVWRRNGGEIL